MVGDQPVHCTPSANNAVAFNELDKLGQTPKTEKICAYLMAAQVQVIDIRNPPTSHLIASLRSRRSHNDGGESQHGGPKHSNHQGDGRERPHENQEGNPRHDGRPSRFAGGQGNRCDHQEVNQPPPRDLRDHLNNRSEEYRVEMERRHHFDEDHAAAGGRPLLPGAAGLQPFTERLQAIRWLASFKVVGVTTYDGKANPVQWLTQYDIAVRAAGGDEDVMANYLLIMLDQFANNWLLSLKENSIKTWEDLKTEFTTNYPATCEQPTTKYDLEKVYQALGDSLRDFICRFLETRNSIPNVTDAETIPSFTKGLHHEQL